MPTFTCEIITTVTGATQAIFPLPPVDDTLFSGTDTSIQVELNGTVLVNPTHWSETPTDYATLVTPAVTGDTLRITRSTVSSAPLVTASSPVMFSITMFNKGMWQLLYLLQELWAQVNKCLSYIVNASGEIVWNFQSRRGASCADPVDTQDVATKNYVDVVVAALSALMYSLLATLRIYIDTQDAAMLSAANAYTRAWFPSITYVSGTDIPIVPSSQVCAAGTTRIWFPVPVYEGVFTINGSAIYPVGEYNWTAGNNYIDLVTPLLIESTIGAFIISSVSAQFVSSSYAILAGATSTTTSAVFDSALVFYNGSLMDFGIEYTHAFGTNTITWLRTIEADGTVTVIVY